MTFLGDTKSVEPCTKKPCTEERRRVRTLCSLLLVLPFLMFSSLYHQTLIAVSLQFRHLPFCAIHNNPQTEEGCCYRVELENPLLLKKRIDQKKSLIQGTRALRLNIQRSCRGSPTVRGKSSVEDDYAKSLSWLLSRQRMLSSFVTAKCTCDPSQTTINMLPELVLLNVFSYLDIVSLHKIRR